MKIGLVAPEYNQPFATSNKYFQAFQKTEKKYLPRWRSPNNGLLTVASLVPNDWDVEYIEEYVDEINYDIEYDIIGISGMTQQADNMYQIAQKFKKKGAYIVIGGIHATVIPDEVAQFADTVIVGEAETTFPQFCLDFQKNQPKSRYKSDGEVDITQSPIPRYDLMKNDYNY